MKNEVKTMSVEEVISVLMNNNKRKGGLRFKNKTYKFLIPSDLQGIKLAPQQLKIYEHILLSGKMEYSEKEVYDKVMEINELSKKQDNYKVFKYYVPSFKENKLLVIE